MIARNRPAWSAADLRFVGRQITTPADQVAGRLAAAARRWTGFGHVLVTRSARAGIYLALVATGLRRAKVLLPAYTCRVVGHSVLRSGNRPVFADVAPPDYNLAPELPAGCLDAVRAAVPAWMYGHPCRLDERLRADRRILLIEDASQCFWPAQLASHGRPNSLAVFSFGIGKPLCAIRGGLVATDDPGLFERLAAAQRSLAVPAPWGQRLWCGLSAAALVGLFGPRRYRFVQGIKRVLPAGMAEDTSSGRIDTAAFVPGGLDRWQQLLLASQMAAAADQRRRLDLMRTYRRGLEGVGGVRPVGDGSWPAPWFVILARRRDALRRELLRRGVETVLAYPYALPELPEFAAAGRPADYPHARSAARGSLALPLYPALGQRQIRYICACIARFYG